MVGRIMCLEKSSLIYKYKQLELLVSFYFFVSSIKKNLNALHLVFLCGI